MERICDCVEGGWAMELKYGNHLNEPARQFGFAAVRLSVMFR
jgi:hypothetical protein